MGVNRPFKLGLILVWPLWVVFAYLFYNKEPFVLTKPSNESVNAWSFTDTLDLGNSEIKFDTSTANRNTRFTYTLKSGYQYPYVGINFLMDKDLLPDLGRYNYVRIKIKATQGSRLPIVIGLWQGENIKPNGSRFMEYILPVGKEWNTTDVDFSNFRTPEWWLKANGVREKELAKPDFSQVRFLNVQSCQILGNDKQDTIEIEEVSLRIDMTYFYLISALLSIFYYAALLFLVFGKKGKQSVVFSYVKTEAVSHSVKEEEAVFAFITSHYEQQSLSIVDIQNGTGISEAKISAIIKNKSGLTFKQFLNKLRLTESKRLLLETDLQVSEIAYKVGYSNVSHFNRIFKEVENCTPNDFRRQSAIK